MKPEEIGTIDKASKEVIQREQEIEENEKNLKNIKNKKKKMRGRDKAGKKYIINKRETRKDRVHDDATRQKLVDMANNAK